MFEAVKGHSYVEVFMDHVLDKANVVVPGVPLIIFEPNNAMVKGNDDVANGIDPKEVDKG